MIVSIHQPSYFPWLGWLHKVRHSDVFILLDDVQLADRAYQHRNIFLTNDGKEKMLTVSINKKGYRDLPLKDILLNSDMPWQTDHLNFIRNNYNKHPYYKEVLEQVMPVFEKKYSTLGEVLTDVTMLCAEMFGLQAKILLQSELPYDKEAKKSDLMLNLSKLSGCDTYMSGQGAKEYMQDDVFANEGISVIYQEFSHPKYKQMSTGSEENFMPGMGCLDLLFNVGVDQSKEFINGI